MGGVFHKIHLHTIFIPDMMLTIFRMKFLSIFRVNMPIGLVNGGCFVEGFPFMEEWTPEILYRFDEIGGPFIEAHAEWTVEVAVERPENFQAGPGSRRVKAKSDLFPHAAVPECIPFREKVAIAFEVLCPQYGEVRVQNQRTQKHERQG